MASIWKLLFGKDGAVYKPVDIDPVVEAVAEKFRTGPLYRCELDRSGISEMAVKLWNDGSEAHIKWYSTGDLHSISIDGKKTVTSNAETEYILQVAMKRAEEKFHQDLEEVRVKYKAYLDAQNISEDTSD